MEISPQTKVQMVLDKLKKAGWIRVIFHPIILLITTPRAFVRTLMNSSFLLMGKKWDEYNRFFPHNAFNSLTYWTQAKAVYLYGKKGKAPNIGTGDYKLSNWLNIAIFSHYAYWKCSNVLIITSFLMWGCSNLLWLNVIDPLWVLLVLFFAVFSTMMYLNAFIMQNYNILGWAFFPLGLYALITNNQLLLVLSWVLVSLGSFSVAIIAALITLVFAFSTQSLFPVIAFFPAGFKLLTHLYPLFASKNLAKGMMDTAKSIGFFQKVKYKRKMPKFIALQDVYMLFLLLQFIAVAYFIEASYLSLLYGTLCIFILNQSKVRFLDIQSLYFLILTISTVVVLNTPSLLLLTSFLFLNNPMPILLVRSLEAVDTVPVLKPFHIQPFVNDMKHFFRNVKNGSKVLISCNNPENNYERIYDGFQANYELPIYAMMDEEIHFFPDWWSIYELNNEGDPEYWGRTPKEVINNLSKINSDTVLIYQKEDRVLSNKWLDNNFKVIAEFHWDDYQLILGDNSIQQHHWWLLRYQFKK